MTGMFEYVFDECCDGQIHMRFSSFYFAHGLGKQVLMEARFVKIQCAFYCMECTKLTFGG